VNSLVVEDITCDIYLPKFLYAPIGDKDIIGKAVYKQGNKILLEEPIRSEENIEPLPTQKTAVSIIFNNFKHIFN
jgi:hypothetical protein